VLVGEGSDLCSGDVDRADWASFAEHRYGYEGPIIGRAGDIGELVLGVCAHVWNVNDCPIQNRPTRRAPTRGRTREFLSKHRDRGWPHVVKGDVSEHPPIECRDVRVQPLAQADGALGDGIEDGLGVRGRAADDTEDLSGGGFALQRLRQALLEVVYPGALARARLADNRGLGFDLRLRGIHPPAHRPLPTSQGRKDHSEIDDRLGDGDPLGKGGRPDTPSRGTQPGW
jgi:hypothetical protein